MRLGWTEEKHFEMCWMRIERWSLDLPLHSFPRSFLSSRYLFWLFPFLWVVKILMKILFDMFWLSSFSSHSFLKCWCSTFTFILHHSIGKNGNQQRPVNDWLFFAFVKDGNPSQPSLPPMNRKHDIDKEKCFCIAFACNFGLSDLIGVSMR